MLALVGEVGELAELLQWRSDDEVARDLADDDGTLRARLADEAADVLLYLTRLADVCGIDLAAAGHAKLDRNHTRFPRS
jgi:NTP pyrophosphatase (non-canonical NTP hydrolase)